MTANYLVAVHPLNTHARFTRVLARVWGTGHTAQFVAVRQCTPMIDSEK